MTESPQTVRLKRLQYRSLHRGCKETDLILGQFATTQLPALPTTELDSFEAFLDEDDADIWGWLVGKAPVPPRYAALLAGLRAVKLAV